MPGKAGHQVCSSGSPLGFSETFERLPKFPRAVFRVFPEVSCSAGFPREQRGHAGSAVSVC